MRILLFDANDVHFAHASLKIFWRLLILCRLDREPQQNALLRLGASRRSLCGAGTQRRVPACGRSGAHKRKNLFPVVQGRAQYFGYAGDHAGSQPFRIHPIRTAAGTHRSNRAASQPQTERPPGQNRRLVSADNLKKRQAARICGCGPRPGRSRPYPLSFLCNRHANRRWCWRRHGHGRYCGTLR